MDTKMQTPPVVYLDTQDYSRFGDVLRGKSDQATAELFETLKDKRKANEAIFAVSMPILSELLQYDANHRETTISKARAVEILCGPWALPFPTRLIAAEIAEATQSLGLFTPTRDTEALTSDRYWYPNVADAFADMHDGLKRALEEELSATSLSRHQRRAAASKARRMDFYKAAREQAPAMAGRYGLPVESMTTSIVPLLRGTITPEEASRRLFLAVAEPVKFVEVYFEKTANNALPDWIAKLGRDIQRSLSEVSAKMPAWQAMDGAKPHLQAMLLKQATKFAHILFAAALDDTKEFGMSTELRQSLLQDKDFGMKVPACNIFGNALRVYLSQILGLAATGAKIEHSFGGDLLHALYLPHVDLWRGDRRFSAVLSESAPNYAHRVVPLLKNLPLAIDNWHVARLT